MSKTILSKRTTTVALALSLVLSAVGGIPTLQSKDTSTSGQVSLAWNDSKALANTTGGRATGGSFDDDLDSDYDAYRDSRDYDRNGNYRGDRNQQPMGFFGFLTLMGVLGFMYKTGTLQEIWNSTETSANGLSASSVKNNLQTTETSTGTATTYNLNTPQPTYNNSSRHTSRTYHSGHPSAHRRSRTASRRFAGELKNNTVTITQLQVGMFASARHVQQALNKIATETDMSTKQGLAKSLRETVVALLRSPDTWSHVCAQSKKCRTRQDAKTTFESLSLEERGRFATETLSNEQGRVQIQKSKVSNATGELADYIVVTLIIGSAHDNPLIGKISTADQLRAALKTIGSITPEYLMVYEVLWSPQDESDSLTDDELLLNYPHMAPIC